MIYCKYINANMYHIAVHSRVLKRQKIPFVKVLFLGWKQSRRHCHESVNHLII